MTTTRRTHRGPAMPALGPFVTAATAGFSALEGSRTNGRERRRGMGSVSLISAASAGAPRAVDCPSTGTSYQVHRPAADISGAGRWIPTPHPSPLRVRISSVSRLGVIGFAQQTFVHLGRHDR